jgi:L-fuculose-phosphate aldolase
MSTDKMSTTVAVDSLREKLVDACRILYVEGHSDRSLGHVSARIPGAEAQAMCMKPSGLGFEEVRPQDLIIVDFDGIKLAGDRPRHGEYPLHSETYRCRPEVGCVIHTHPPYTSWLSGLEVPLLPLNQDGVLFWERLPVFDETADLILTTEQGRRVAGRMGDPPVVLMRNHGVLVAGENVEEATMLALHLETAAKMHWMALTAGLAFSSISSDTAAKMASDIRKNKKRQTDLFQYHKRKADRVLQGCQPC